MISAKEAAEMYEESESRRITEELNEIDRLVRKCIEECNGNREVIYYNKLSYDSVSILQSLGYEVNNISDMRDGDYYCIKF